MRRTRRWFLPCLLTILIAVAVLSPVAMSVLAAQDAAAAPSFLIEPVGDDQQGDYFVLELKPGESETLTIALGNAGTGEAPARTYAADVFTLVNGGFGIESEDAPRTGTTTWLDYQAKSLDIPPGRMLEREFTVSVPKDASPGQHIAGIVIQTAEPVAIGDSEMLRQNIVKAIAVFITVPGKLKPKLAIGAASIKQGPGSNSLIVEVENAGNVLLKPAGTLTMTTADGDALLSSPIEMGSVYAGMSTIIELPIPTLLDPGDYLVDLDLKDAETGAKAEGADLPAIALDPALAATPEVKPIRIDEVAAEPVLDPATDLLLVVNVTVVLVNDGGPLNGARLTLHVERDGELVEDLPLSSSLVVPSGSTEIAQRYVPLGRWEPGTYAFSVTLEATDLASGQVTLLDTADAAAPVVVP